MKAFSWPLHQNFTDMTEGRHLIVAPSMYGQD